MFRFQDRGILHSTLGFSCYLMNYYSQTLLCPFLERFGFQGWVASCWLGGILFSLCWRYLLNFVLKNHHNCRPGAKRCANRDVQQSIPKLLKLQFLPLRAMNWIVNSHSDLSKLQLVILTLNTVPVGNSSYFPLHCYRTAALKKDSIFLRSAKTVNQHFTK